MELERILFLLRFDGWRQLHEKEFQITISDKNWYARIYRPHGFAPYLIEVSEVYFIDGKPYLKTGNYFYFQTESEYETFATAEIRETELRQFELVDLEAQEEFIHRNYEQLKHMPDGEVIMERALAKINDKKKELLNSKYHG